MGHSDHLTLELVCTEKVFRNIKVQREKVLSFGKMLKESGKIKEEFQNCLKQENRTGAIINLVRELRNRYKPRMKKTRGMTIWTETMEKFSKDNKGREWDH